MKTKLTINGFTKEFEEMTLASAAEPEENDFELRTDKEMRDYFLHLKLPKRYKNRKRNI